MTDLQDDYAVKISFYQHKEENILKNILTKRALALQWKQKIDLLNLSLLVVGTLDSNSQS